MTECLTRNTLPVSLFEVVNSASDLRTERDSETDPVDGLGLEFGFSHVRSHSPRCSPDFAGCTSFARFPRRTRFTSSTVSTPLGETYRFFETVTLTSECSDAFGEPVRFSGHIG